MADLASHRFDGHALKGRNRRLLYEWQRLEERLAARTDITLSVLRTNSLGLPVAYRVAYHLRSICGVQNADRLGTYNPPVFADTFLLQIELPQGYPCVDAPPAFSFLTTDDDGKPIPHPWHPNIRYFGDQAGRVCINMADTYTDLVWGVERIAHYLRYDLYHAKNELPYPEDLRVAQWVITQGEPEGWVFFEQ